MGWIVKDACRFTELAVTRSSLIKGQYLIEWQLIAGPLIYAVVEAQPILAPGGKFCFRTKGEFRHP